MRLTRARINNFAPDYYIVENVRLVRMDGARQAVVSVGLEKQMLEYVDAPLLRVGDEHMWAEGEFSVPSDTVAVPPDTEFREATQVFLAKTPTAVELLVEGSVDEPRH